MSPIICLLAGCGVLLGLAPVPCRADTFSLSVLCFTGSQSSNQAGSISCSDIHGGASASATGVSSTSFGEVSAIALEDGLASAEFTATFQLLVTNAVGSGLFSPCFMIGGTDNFASFGGAAINRTCETFPPGGFGAFIPFEFGVPQTDQLIIMAGASGPTAQASVNWPSGAYEVFQLIDMVGLQPVPSAQVSLIDLATVPEPSLLAPFTILLGLGSLWRYLRRSKG
jgi:hypothetical protein